MPNFFPRVDVKRKPRVSQLVIPIAVLISLSAFLLHSFLVKPLVIHPITPGNVSQRGLDVGPPLTVLTVLFGELNNKVDAEIVTHNCLLISQSRHNFIIYTDNRTHPFCNTCTCRPFTRTQCHLTCANPEQHACNLCEKLVFVRDSVLAFGEFVLLDSDVIIVQPAFLDRLSIRRMAHDFLATFGFSGASEREDPRKGFFNSGVFFIRQLPNLNYSKMLDLMEQMNTNNDQNVITRFVTTHYKNWDSLSRQWNCRLSYLRRTDYPIDLCYNFHGRAGLDALFEHVGKKILRIE